MSERSKGVFSIFLVLFLLSQTIHGQEKKKIIFDTDLAGDIDDAFAHALVQCSPEFEVLGITLADGNTEFRARVSCRMLHMCGQDNIPVAIGRKTREKDRISNQMRWAEKFDRLRPIKQPAADFIIQNLRKHPFQVTIISVGPVTNLGDVIDKDPAAWKMVKEVYSMFGSFYVGYKQGYPPAAEYNVATDVESARKFINSGVQITLAGTDVTAMINFEKERRFQLLMRCSPLTDAICALYTFWNPYKDPILYDPVPVTMAITDEFVETRKAHVQVTDEGYTVINESKPPNCTIGMGINKEIFLDWLTRRLLKQNLDR